MKIKLFVLLLGLIIISMSCKKTSEESSETPLNLSKTEPNADAFRVACIGNSITAGYGIKDKTKDSYPAQMQEILGGDYHIRNFGVNNRTLLRKGDYPYWNELAFQEAKDFQPNIVVIKLGTNDTKPQNWQYADDFVKDYQVFIDVFQALDSKPMIYLCYPVPAFAVEGGISNNIITKEVMPKIDEVAASKGLKIIDLYTVLEDKGVYFPDNIHPNEAGAKIIAETIIATIRQEKE
jgi:lysophospholipase L1-like esterase